MFSTLVNTGFVLALAARHAAAAAQLEITTPSLVQCQNTVISYSGGVAHYALYILPTGDPCADSLVEIPEQTGTSYPWKVTLPAGAKVEMMVSDATGTEAWSGTITVQNSSDASCVDHSATKALIAADSLPQNSSSASLVVSSVSFATLPGAAVEPSTTPGLSGATGGGKTVVPAVDPTVANAAGSSPTSLPSSGLPRTALPTCSLLGVATILLAVIHLT